MIYVHPFVNNIIEWDHSIQVGVEPIILITKYSGIAYNMYHVSGYLHGLYDLHMCVCVRSSESIHDIILVWVFWLVLWVEDVCSSGYLHNRSPFMSDTPLFVLLTIP